MKKLIYTLLLLLAASFTVNAQQQFWYEGIHYEVLTADEYNGGYTAAVISAVEDSYSGEITVPRKVKTFIPYYESTIEKEFDVVAVGNGAFADCAGLTRINLPSTVLSIGDNAFKNCTGLTSISLPYKLTAISKNTFNGCTSLSSITIPAHVQEIGANAFEGCTSLTSISIPGSVTSMDWNVFYGCTGLTRVTINGSMSSLNGTFFGCTGLTNVDIPVSVKTLNGTFTGCTNLTSVNIPSSVTTIGDRTFDGCSRLSNIYIPNSVTSIGDMAFRNTALTVLELPSTVTSVGEDAFYGCTGLTAVTSRALNPPVMANEEGFAAQTYGLAALQVPQTALNAYQNADWWKLFDNIQGNEMYDRCYDFEQDGIYYLITGLNTVDVTYRDTQYNSYSGSVTVPATVTRNGVTYSVTGIGSRAFYGCTGLNEVSLPDGIKRIGEEAFYNDYSMTSINLPGQLTAIGDKAFFDCSGLT